MEFFIMKAEGAEIKEYDHNVHDKRRVLLASRVEEIRMVFSSDFNWLFLPFIF